MYVNDLVADFSRAPGARELLHRLAGKNSHRVSRAPVVRTYCTNECFVSQTFGEVSIFIGYSDRSSAIQALHELKLNAPKSYWSETFAAVRS